jgi:hypothetical protein
VHRAARRVDASAVDIVVAHRALRIFAATRVRTQVTKNVWVVCELLGIRTPFVAGRIWSDSGVQKGGQGENQTYETYWHNRPKGLIRPIWAVIMRRRSMILNTTPPRCLGLLVNLT